jgi:hypothetical protein
MIAITILSVFSSANQTMEKTIQSANETGQEVKQTNKQTTDKIGSKITREHFLGYGFYKLSNYKYLEFIIMRNRFRYTFIYCTN